MAENKKLIIDEDWKNEAQKEKEILAEKEKAGQGGKGERPGRQGPLPEADFPSLVSMLTTQAFYALGLIRVKGEPESPLDLEAAQFNIDMLSMLQAKTQGNLEPDEAKMLEETLHNLRMAFVQLAGK